MKGPNPSGVAEFPEEALLQARALRDLLVHISVELCAAGPGVEREITARLSEAVRANKLLLALLSGHEGKIGEPSRQAIFEVRSEWKRARTLLDHRTQYYLGRLQMVAARCSGYNARGQYSLMGGASFSLRV